jgi:ATP-binding cassette, subfamily A (ABC1), member 3
LQAGECFALLGVNGAGKSTTFKSLTHEVKPTSGRISIAGYDISTHFEEARKLIGYCPQPNLIFDTMSVEEHIYYYARIKGIPASKRKYVVEKSIE